MSLETFKKYNSRGAGLASCTHRFGAGLLIASYEPYKKFDINFYRSREVLSAFFLLNPLFRNFAKSELKNINEEHVTLEELYENDMFRFLKLTESFAKQLNIETHMRSVHYGSLIYELHHLFYENLVGQIGFFQSDKVNPTKLKTRTPITVFGYEKSTTTKDTHVLNLIGTEGKRDSLVVLTPWEGQHVSSNSTYVDNMCLVGFHEKQPEILDGKKVCFTGASKMPREALFYLTEIYGGIPLTSVTKTTDLLVVGNQKLGHPSIKEKSAAGKGVKNIVSEEKYLQSFLPNLPIMRLDQQMRKEYPDIVDYFEKVIK